MVNVSLIPLAFLSAAGLSRSGFDQKPTCPECKATRGPAALLGVLELTAGKSTWVVGRTREARDSAPAGGQRGSLVPTDTSAQGWRGL